MSQAELKNKRAKKKGAQQAQALRQRLLERKKRATKNYIKLNHAPPVARTRREEPRELA
jgi:hypothetical protein